VDGGIPASGGKGYVAKEGEAGWQADGSYLTPEGQKLTSEMEQASYLRTVQDWIIRPQLKGVTGVAGVDAIGGYVREYHVQPIPEKLIALWDWVCRISLMHWSATTAVWVPVLSRTTAKRWR
jgi:hypothetical protein